MKTGDSKLLTPELAAELRALDAMSDADIDTGDIPVVARWSGAVRGKFYRPVKRQITLRLDADVVDFFEAQGKGYRTRTNEALREWVEARAHRATGKPG